MNFTNLVLPGIEIHALFSKTYFEMKHLLLVMHGDTKEL